MTLLIHRRSVLAFLLFVIALTLGFAVYQYLVMSSLTFGPGDVKVVAERILFVGILVGGIVLATGVVLLIRAINLTAILDKLVTMNRMTGYSPEVALNRLGEVGAKIALLQSQTADLSARKSRKIASLSSLIQYVMSQSEALLLVADTLGQLVYVSNALLEKLGIVRGEVVGRRLVDLISDVDVPAATRAMNRSRLPFEVARTSGTIALNPIFGNDGEAHYVVIIVNKTLVDEMKGAAKADRPAVAKAPSRRNVLPRLFGGRKMTRK